MAMTDSAVLSHPPIFILTGPSGVGKTTVAHVLLRNLPKLRRIITYTTRARRSGEINHRDYHFVTRAVFQKKLAAGDFFEHANVYGDLYGNAWVDLRALQAKGYSVLFVVDVQGARTLRKKLKGIVFFLQPEHLTDLRARLARRRSTESAAQIARRLATATAELKQINIADHLILNKQGKQSETISTVGTLIKLYQAVSIDKTTNLI